MQYSGGTPGEQPSALSAAGAAAAAGAATQAGGAAQQPQPAQAQPQAAQPQQAGQQAVTGTHVKTDQEKIGRNDPCWCGSGKKYKKCHGA